MADPEKLILSDRSKIPTDELIFSLIGDKKDHWLRIMKYMSETCKDSSGEWNYYNDGKQWLFKMVYKKKTIFWAGILTGTFRITFYLGNKAEPVMDGSNLPDEIKDQFRNAKRYGLIRPVSFIVNDDSDVDNILKMIDIKLKLK